MPIDQGRLMSTTDRVIMVVDESEDRSLHLKSLIEFMDAPSVRTAEPANWHATLSDERLAAVFLPRDLAEDQLRGLLEDIGRFDPNVPIVFVERQEHA